MPTQGPGTKLVLKGLKLAFPGIAEKRAREEQEDREYWERKNASRNIDDDNRQGGSVRSNHQGDYDAPEDNMRSGSFRRGPSVHSNRDNPGSRNQSRRHTRSGSIAQGPSHHRTGGSRGSRFEDDMPAESVRRGPSVWGSEAGSQRGEHQSTALTRFRPDIEEVRYTHQSANRSGQSSGRQDGPSRQNRASGGSPNNGPQRAGSMQNPSREMTRFRPDIEEFRYTHSPRRSGQSSRR